MWTQFTVYNYTAVLTCTFSCPAVWIEKAQSGLVLSQVNASCLIFTYSVIWNCKSIIKPKLWLLHTHLFMYSWFFLWGGLAFCCCSFVCLFVCGGGFNKSDDKRSDFIIFRLPSAWKQHHKYSCHTQSHHRLPISSCTNGRPSFTMQKWKAYICAFHLFYSGYPQPHFVALHLYFVHSSCSWLIRITELHSFLLIQVLRLQQFHLLVIRRKLEVYRWLKDNSKFCSLHHLEKTKAVVFQYFWFAVFVCWRI